MYIYFLKREQLYRRNIGHYIGYGIGVYRRFNGREYLIRYIPDVFTERRFAEKMVRNCNALQLEPIHLEEIIEEFLCEEIR